MLKSCISLPRPLAEDLPELTVPVRFLAEADMMALYPFSDFDLQPGAMLAGKPHLRKTASTEPHHRRSLPAGCSEPLQPEKSVHDFCETGLLTNPRQYSARPAASWRTKNSREATPLPLQPSHEALPNVRSRTGCPSTFQGSRVADARRRLLS